MQDRLRLQIRDESDVITARREGRALAGKLGFSLADATAVEIAIGELGQNVLRYAQRGTMTLNVVEEAGIGGIEILCHDYGPGFEDLEAVLSGRFVSEKGLGIGLSGVRNLMDDFEATSVGGAGTRILARKWLRVKPEVAHVRPAESEGYSFTVEQHLMKSTAGDIFRIAVVSRPAAGATVNGDAYFAYEQGDEIILGLIDGLGHGYEAAKAARLAVSCVEGTPVDDLGRLIRVCHNRIRQTRGVVAGVGRVSIPGRVLTFCGVGNIEGRIFGKGGKVQRHLISSNGILGHNIRGARETAYPFEPGNLLVLHSDGVSGKFSIDRGEVRDGDLLEMSERIAREYGRYTDDATIMMVRWEVNRGDVC